MLDFAERPRRLASYFDVAVGKGLREASNGIGINGALSSGVYTPVYESGVGARSGRVDLTWQLALPPGIAQAGTAQVVLRWKLEAFTP